MPIYQQESGNILAAITAKGIGVARDIAHEQGLDLGAALMASIAERTRENMGA